MFHQRYEPFPPASNINMETQKFTKVHMRSPFGNKFTDNFETSKPRPYVFASKVNTSNKIIFHPSFYKNVEMKKCEETLFLGRRQNPRKVGETDDLSEW